MDGKAQDKTNNEGDTKLRDRSVITHTVTQEDYNALEAYRGALERTRIGFEQARCREEAEYRRVMRNFPAEETDYFKPKVK